MNHLIWAGRMKGHDAEPPELWELSIIGKAWRTGMTLESVTKCAVCGLTWFPKRWHLEVDEARWDGSDFINLDGNPMIVVVTSRIRELFLEHQLSNTRFVAIPDEAKRIYD